MQIPPSKNSSLRYRFLRFGGCLIALFLSGAVLAGEPLEPSFDGHANCFIETGFHKALLIDFNYDTEPQPGHYPWSIGMPLLKDSRLNHLGKLLFQSVYWHSLLPGRDLPGLTSTMPTTGKRLAATKEP